MRNTKRKIYFKLFLMSCGVLAASLLFAIALFKPSSEREPAAVRNAARLPFDHVQDLAVNDLYAKIAIRGERARRVVFHPETIAVENQRTPERVIRLNLFDDTILNLRLQRPSEYGVNGFLYAGTVEGDPESRVRLQLSETRLGSSDNLTLDATIFTQGREYRIISAGQPGQHIVILLPRDGSHH